MEKSESKLKAASELLAEIDEYNMSENIESVRLEVHRVANSNGGEEFIVKGSRNGLLHLSRHIFDLVLKDFPGAHAHFDEHTTNHSDVPLTITKLL